MRVVIIGAGLGGLCLAQGLRRRGIAAPVFERDRTPFDRPQGYRLHLDADGINALHAVLTPALFAQFDATAMKAAPFTTIVDPAFAVRARRSHDQHGGTSAQPVEGLAAHVNVNRATLREILLSGIDVHYGKAFVAYEDGIARFADGSSVEFDVLVGADGNRSPVRHQRAPHAVVQDSGVRAIYSRLPWRVAEELVPAQAREDVFTVATDERKAFLGLGPVRFPTPPAALGLAPQDDYVVCIVGGPAALFAAGDPHAVAQQVVEAWPAPARAVVAASEASFLVEMWTSVPTTLPPPTNVTLLGDAIHAMTPTLGRGANLAMRDGANLAGRLDDLVGYEAEMLDYGFAVVREAAAMGTRLMGQRPL